jgi:hypothetical protein
MQVTLVPRGGPEHQKDVGPPPFGALYRRSWATKLKSDVTYIAALDVIKPKTSKKPMKHRNTCRACSKAMVVIAIEIGKIK